MRVLHAFWDGGGNTGPQLAIARTLTERGHEVRMLANDCQREKVEAAGATFLPYTHAPPNDSSDPSTDLVRDWEAKTPLGAFARIRDRLMYGPAALFARDVLEAHAAAPADVICWDYLLPGAGIGAEAAERPSIAIVHTIYPLPTVGLPPMGQGFAPARGAPGRIRDRAVRRATTQAFAPGLAPANRARAELGLDPMDTPFHPMLRADRMLVLTAAEFDYGGLAELPANVRHVGAVLDPPRAASWDPPWDAGDERPLVAASFSTTFMDQEGPAARVVEALGELGVRGLLTTGPALDPASLPGRENVAVRRFVPHSAVLGAAALVICHGGMGTTHAALAAGVPLLLMPGGRDQNDVAARVVHHGAGRRLRQGASARRIRDAVSAVLGDTSYAEAARRLGAEIRAQDGAAVAATEIETCGAG